MPKARLGILPKNIFKLKANDKATFSSPTAGEYAYGPTIGLTRHCHASPGNSRSAFFIGETL